MLTQTMPALLRALNGVLPDAALKQLTQALGNCQQPLTSRGDVNVAPANNVYNYNGVYNGYQWNPQDYQYLFPTINNIDNRTTIDVPGWQGPGQWVTNNYAGNTFNFPTTNAFNVSQYYGGPTLNVGGDTVFNNAYTNNLTTNNIIVNTINGVPFEPPAPIPGPPGMPGKDGRDGQDGVDWFEGWGFPNRYRIFPLRHVTDASVVGQPTRAPVTPRGLVARTGDATVTIPTYKLPDASLAADGTEEVHPELRNYYLSGNIQLIEDGTDQLSVTVDNVQDISLSTTNAACNETIDFALVGNLSVGAQGTTNVETTVPYYNLNESGTTSGTATIPTYALSGDLSLEQDSDDDGHPSTTPVTGTVPGYALTGAVSVSQSGTISCNISIPKYRFDSPTQSLVPDGTESVTISIPGWEASNGTLALSESGTLPVTATVPKLKANSTLGIVESGSTSASVTVPSYSLHSDTQSWTVAVPAYGITENTLAVRTASGFSGVVTTPVPTISYTGVQKSGTCSAPRKSLQSTFRLPTVAVEEDETQEKTVDMSDVQWAFAGIPSRPVVVGLDVRPAAVQRTPVAGP
ncbi:hypothetical protein EBZ39_14345 [bacterium]|nr:hypothetical protein [bacterium]